MGLWIKCPKCQTHNPLSLKACAACGSSLDNLPLEQRVYVLAPEATVGAQPPEPTPLLQATPAPESPLPAAAPVAKAASGGAKVAKKARTKKH
jgi:hypothetical protein